MEMISVLRSQSSYTDHAGLVGYGQLQSDWLLVFKRVASKQVQTIQVNEISSGLMCTFSSKFRSKMLQHVTYLNSKRKKCYILQRGP